MSYQSIKAVLFDLDGTLLHTVPDLAAAVNAMLADLKLPALEEAIVAQYVGKGAENLVHRSLTGDMNGKAPVDLFEQGMNLFQSHYDIINGRHAQFYEGVLEGLEAFAANGLKLAVVTNKPIRFTQPLLERTGIAHRFEVIVGGDTCIRKKPDRMPLDHACEAMGLVSGQALMIGDSHNDSQAARAAETVCWLLPYGYNEGKPVTDTPCDGIVQTLLEAAQRLADLQQS